MAAPFDVPLPAVGAKPWNLNPAIQEVRARVGSTEDVVNSGRLSETGLKSSLVSQKPTIVYVDKFGAVGDGVTDDTAAIQAAIDSVPGNAVFMLTGVHKVSTLYIDKVDWRLTGPGTILDGKIVIGHATGSTTNQFWFIDNVKFKHSTPLAEGSVSIEVLLSRRGTIENCHFDGAEKAISVPAFAGAVFHGTAQVKVIKNEFERVGYALYVDRLDEITWLHASDFKFIANTVNWARYKHIHCKSIDGIVIDSNVFFFRSYDTLDEFKLQNIYIGESDWVIITGNNIFEAGYEGIQLDKPRHFTISNNLIAWPGQRDLASAVKLTGTTSLNGTITGNVISKFTRHAVQLDLGLSGFVRVSANLFEYTDNPGTYYGPSLTPPTAAITSINHYGVANGSIAKVVDVGNELRGNLFNIHPGGIVARVGVLPDSGVSAIRTQVSVTAANTNIVKLSSSRDGTTIYGGLMFIEARNGSSDTGNNASYVLHVTKSPGGTLISQISAQGLTAGNSANWPSFTFSFDSATNQLRASPVSNTSGSFYFYITAMGNVQLAQV